MAEEIPESRCGDGRLYDWYRSRGERERGLYGPLGGERPPGERSRLAPNGDRDILLYPLSNRLPTPNSVCAYLSSRLSKSLSLSRMRSRSQSRSLSQSLLGDLILGEPLLDKLRLGGGGDLLIGERDLSLLLGGEISLERSLLNLSPGLIDLRLGGYLPPGT